LYSHISKYCLIVDASSQQGVPPLTIGLSMGVAVLGGVLIVGVLVILYRRLVSLNDRNTL